MTWGRQGSRGGRLDRLAGDAERLPDGGERLVYEVVDVLPRLVAVVSTAAVDDGNPAGAGRLVSVVLADIRAVARHPDALHGLLKRHGAVPPAVLDHRQQDPV